MALEKHRDDYISWDEYFMGIAQLSALRRSQSRIDWL